MTSADDPVGRVCDLLKPWSDAAKRKETQGAVEEALDLMRQTIPKHFARDAVQRVRERARNIMNTIDVLDRKITNAPPELDSGDARLLLNELRRVRQIYAAVADDTLTSASKDNVKELCARMALSLIYRFSAKAPKSGSPKSAFRQIASVLYEGVTGEADRDFERICETALRAVRRVHDTSIDGDALASLERAGLVQIVDKKTS